MQTTKKQPTNPFVYVIAAAVLAILSIGLRYLVDALDNHNAAIEKVTEVKDYLSREKAKNDAKDPAATEDAAATSTSSATPAPEAPASN